MNRISRGRLFLVLLVLIVAIILAFVLLNVEIFNRLTIISPKCIDRIAEQDYTPAEFYHEGLDISPYLVADYEDVSFPSRDKRALISGFYIPNIPNPVSAISQTKTIIIVHGYNDCKRRPASLLPAGMLHRNGFNALVIDLRNHGDSGIDTGRTAGGATEYNDVLGAWDWLISEKGIPEQDIGVFGYSMGGASILIAMAQEPGIVAGWDDSSFTTMSDILYQELEKEGFPGWLNSPALMIGRLLFGEDLMAHTPLEAVTGLNGRPLFIVHSEIDIDVPLAHSEQLVSIIADSGDTTETWYSPSTSHVGTMFDFPELYETELVRFFDENLGQ